ncbi:MAG: DUF1295 domain-containing protein [Spirochaetota bacterium]
MTVIGSLWITLLLLFFSGIPLLEKSAESFSLHTSVYLVIYLYENNSEFS